MNYYRTFLKFYEGAAEKMCQDCQAFIEKESKILDLGCGSAIVTKKFQDFFKADMIGVDVVDRRVFPIPFKIIDGKSLPFADNHFDTTLIFYVLHHSQEPICLLKEAKRVTKDKILIYEDMPEGIFSKIFCWIHALSFDNIFGQENKTSFRTEKEWKEVFEDLNLNLIFEKRIFSFFNPVKKKLFVLKKAGHVVQR